MVREILFRAKLAGSDGFVYGIPNCVYVGNKIDSLCDSEDGTCHYIRTDTLGQFTGLTDKNGVKIFEGDILEVCNGSINGYEWKDEPYPVEYKLNKGFDMCMFCWNDKGESIMDKTHWCKVIGNIHDNND